MAAPATGVIRPYMRVSLGDTTDTQSPQTASRAVASGRLRSILQGVLSPKSKTPYGDMLGQIQEEQQQFYESAYQPLAADLIADVNSTAIVDAAKEATNAYSAERTAARGARQRARLGVTGTPAEQTLSGYKAQLGATVTSDAAINQARVQQQERNTALRNDLINISRGIQTSAINSATNAAQAEASRNIANEQASAQNKAARNQLYGSIAAMALMLLV